MDINEKLKISNFKLKNGELPFHYKQWVTIICTAHTNLTNKSALVVGYTTNNFYQVLYKEESLKHFFETDTLPFFIDAYFGYSQIAALNIKFEEHPLYIQYSNKTNSYGIKHQ